MVTNDNNNNKYNACNWKEMMNLYIIDNKDNPKSTLNISEEDKEKTIFNEFINYLYPKKEENNDLNNNNSSKEVPKFFFRNPLVFNELQLAVKSEAKHRFLINITNDS